MAIAVRRAPRRRCYPDGMNRPFHQAALAAALILACDPGSPDTTASRSDTTTTTTCGPHPEPMTLPRYIDVRDVVFKVGYPADETRRIDREGRDGVTRRVAPQAADDFQSFGDRRAEV